LRKGDANTKYFHLMANARKKKNYIHTLQTNSGLVVTQSEKHAVNFDHFTQHIGSYTPRGCIINYSSLGWQPRSLEHLDLLVFEEELHLVIKDALEEEAPGPDGFIGLLFSLCWPIIKEDLNACIATFFSLNKHSLHLLNHAYIVLIPKTSCPKEIIEYRPINLTHNFAKILIKLLTNILAPKLSHLISNNQITFVKKRCIHNNFVYVQEVIKALHKKKIPSLFIKLDISKAFNMVNWPYLLGITTHLGFGQNW
jgi:hypothetical protein